VKEFSKTGNNTQMSSEMNTIAAAGPKQMAESPKPRKISNNTVAPKD
jgi:hypothetical protein